VAKQQSELRRYAVVGAERRLLEIAEEAAQIFRVFPELRERGRGFDALRRGGPSAAESSGGAAPARRRGRRRRTMSAEARKRISDAQKARWAKHRSEAAATGGGARKKK
jgi:hypothetical protein